MRIRQQLSLARTGVRLGLICTAWTMGVPVLFPHLFPQIAAASNLTPVAQEDPEERFEALPTDSPDEIPEEIPEEILRTEIITEARSPINGEVLTAAEYAQLEAELAAMGNPPLLSQDIRYLIFLLEFRRGFKPIVPFL